MKRLFFLTIFLISCFLSKAQYDSSRSRQAIGAYGYDVNNYSFKTIIISRDTIKMAYKDSGAIAYKNNNFYCWNGIYWVIPNSEYSSLTLQNVIDNGSVFDQNNTIDAFGHTLTFDSLQTLTLKRYGRNFFTIGDDGRFVISDAVNNIQKVEDAGTYFEINATNGGPFARFNRADSLIKIYNSGTSLVRDTVAYLSDVRATGADADSSVFATVHKLYTTIDSLGNLIISENLGNTNLTQSDAIRTYDGDGGELSFSNLGKFKVSASDSAIIKSSNIYGTATNSFVIDSIGGMQLRKYGPDAVVTINLDENSAIINSENIDDTSTLIVTHNGISMTSSNYISLTADSILITNTPSTLTTDYDVLVRDENTGKVGIATISGGGSADSSYQTITIGTAPNIVGELLNESFPGTSIPATFTNPSSASVTYNDKLIVASGSGGTADFSKYLQAVSYYNYDKEEFAITVVPKTKTSTSYGLGITFASNAAYFNISNTSTLNLSSGADSGKVSFNGVSSGNLSFSVGDTIIYSLKVDGWNITVSAWNKTTNQRVQVNEVNSNRLGTGGRFRLCFMGGEQDITNLRIYSFNKKGGIAVLGDSHTSGTNATIEASTYAMRLQYGSKYNYSNFGYPSITTINILLGGNWMNSIWANVRTQDPDYAVIALGYNDATNGDTASFRTAYRAIIDSCIANSIVPILTTLVPRTNNSSPIMTNYNLVISSLATQYSLKLADVFTALSANSGGTNVINPNYLSNDNIHLSDSGHLVMSNTIRALGGELFKTFVKDSTSNVTFNDLPTSESTLPLLGIENGKVYQISNKIPTSYILNSANNYAHTIQNASISINGDIKTRGGNLQVSDSIGLRINFNGGNQYAAGNAGSNIVITNAGAGGVGYPAAFPTLRQGVTNKATNNFLLTNVVSKSANVGVIDSTAQGNVLIGYTMINSQVLGGDNNTAINSDNTTLSTGSGNIAIGKRSLKAVTTGSEILSLATANIGAANFGATTSNVLQIGDVGYDGSFASGSVVINPGSNVNPSFFMGGTSGFGSTVDVFHKANRGTNTAGITTTYYGSAGTGTGVSGSIFFNNFTSGSSGTTRHSVSTNTLQLSASAITAYRGVRFANWTTANRPSSPGLGEQGFNTTDTKMEYWNGSVWVQF
jgi:lysophospholipase L1-like esterase